MQELRINLFGVFEARIHDVPVRMPTRRVELILALLALSPEKAFSRSHLAALLWPEQEDAPTWPGTLSKYLDTFQVNQRMRG